MGVYIKGMEMPRFCADCPFRETRYDPGYYQYEKCKASGRIFNECRFDVNTFAERLNDCPLQPIDDEKVEKTQQELINAWAVLKRVIKDETP